MIWSVKTWAVYGHNAMKSGRTARQACLFLRSIHVSFEEMALAQFTSCTCDWFHPVAGVKYEPIPDEEMLV